MSQEEKASHTDAAELAKNIGIEHDQPHSGPSGETNRKRKLSNDASGLLVGLAIGLSGVGLGVAGSGLRFLGLANKPAVRTQPREVPLDESLSAKAKAQRMSQILNNHQVVAGVSVEQGAILPLGASTKSIKNQSAQSGFVTHPFKLAEGEYGYVAYSKEHNKVTIKVVSQPEQLIEGAIPIPKADIREVKTDVAFEGGVVEEYPNGYLPGERY